MADDASPSSPSFISKLPVELLKRIVEEVHEQDKAFRQQRQVRHAARLRPEDYFADQRLAEMNIPEGRWSLWYLRGIAALSLVDKRFRALALPRLCDTVTFRQLTSLFFRYTVMYSPSLLAGITTLDMRGAVQEQFGAVAPFLPMLSISRLVVLPSSIPVVDPPMLGPVAETWAETDLVYKAFRELAQKATSIEASNLPPSQLGFLLAGLDHSKLRHLKLTFEDLDESNDDGVFSFADASPRILHYFQLLIHLETLEIGDEGTWRDEYEVHPSWTTQLYLPCLTSVTVWARRGADSIFSLFRASAPNLRSFRLANYDSYIYKTITLPDIPFLRHFSLDGRARADITFPSNSAIASLSLRFDTPPLTCADHLPPLSSLPPSLRSITLVISSALLPEDAESFGADCAARGIAFRLRWLPDKFRMEYSLLEMGHEGQPPEHAFAVDPVALSAAQDTLDWCQRRLDWCKRFGDDRTAQELITALVRVRERQAIELM